MRSTCRIHRKPLSLGRLQLTPLGTKRTSKACDGRARIEPDHGVAILLALIERDRDRVVCHGLV